MDGDVLRGEVRDGGGRRAFVDNSGDRSTAAPSITPVKSMS